MEAASRPPLEALPELPAEEPLDSARVRAAAPAAAGAAPATAEADKPEDSSPTGLNFVDPEMFLAPGQAASAVPVVNAAEQTARAPEPSPELELLEDPVVNDLLTAPPPPPAPPAPAAAPIPAAALKSPAESPAEAAAVRAAARVPIAKTASLSAAATKLAAASGAGRPAARPAATGKPAAAPAAAPASAAATKGEAAAKPAAAAPKPTPATTAKAESPAAKLDAPSLASWASARAAAAQKATGGGASRGPRRTRSGEDGLVPSSRDRHPGSRCTPRDARAAGRGGERRTASAGDGPGFHRAQPGGGALPLGAAAAEGRHGVRALLSRSPGNARSARVARAGQRRIAAPRSRRQARALAGSPAPGMAEARGDSGARRRRRRARDSARRGRGEQQQQEPPHGRAAKAEQRTRARSRDQHARDSPAAEPLGRIQLTGDHHRRRRGRRTARRSEDRRVALAISHLPHHHRPHRPGARGGHQRPRQGLERASAHCAQQLSARSRQLPADARRPRLARPAAAGFLGHDRHTALSSGAQRRERRLRDDTARREPTARRHQQRPAEHALEPRQELEHVVQLEPLRSEEIRRQRGTERGEQSREAAESGELREHTLHDRAATRAERSQHGALVAALVTARLYRRQQHRQPGEQGEDEDTLYRKRRLVEHGAHLTEQLIDVEDRDTREAVRELRQRAGGARCEIGAREVSAGGAFEHPGRKDDEKIRLEGIPLHLADARDRHLARLAGDIEGQLISDLEAERLLEFACE